MVRIENLNLKTKVHIIKPKCVHGYNCHMGAVDLTDMMIVNIEWVRHTQRLYKNCFFILWILLIWIIILYMSKTSKKPILPQFNLELVCHLLEKYLRRQQTKKDGRSSRVTPIWLMQRHFPFVISPTERRQDHVVHVLCAKTSIDGSERGMWQVGNCLLCTAPCFDYFHLFKNY